MKRKIFALLFLLSGLAMFAAPAQAAQLQKIGTQIERPSELGEAAHMTISAERIPPAVSLPVLADVRMARMAATPAVPVPTVLFGVDRAFE